MKPLKLVMSAFGPFSKVVEIEFDQFGTSGLFLVTGDTGSGKTTIFDAISFALFGNASGENRTSDCFRSDFAGGEDKTYVELTFLQKGKTYQITRNPMYKRNKISGSGTTEEKANATLILPDTTVISGNTKVTESVTELLGIDWKQYKQIAMIAQGEFLQLLTANSNERGIIFRKVFGTQIYEEIQKKLKMMSNELKYKCEDLDKSILQFLNGILCDPESVHYNVISEWKYKPDIHQVQKMMELLVLLLGSDQSKYKEESQKNQLLSEKMKEKAAEYMAAESANQSFAKLRLARGEQEKLLWLSEEMKQKEAKLLLAKKALYTVKPIEDIYLQVKKDVTELSGDIEKQSVQANKLEEELKRYAELLKEKEASKPRINELTVMISRQEAELVKYEAKASLEQEQKGLNDHARKLEKLLEQLTNQRGLLSQEQKEKQTELEKDKNADCELLECQSLITQRTDGINKLNQFFEEYAVLDKENKTLLLYQKEFQQAEYLYHEKNRAYQDMEARFLREQAGIMALSLQEGIPCPVCGSTKHPAKAVPTQGAPSEQQLKQDKQQLEKVHKQMTDTSSKCQSQLTRVELLQKQLQKSASEQLTDSNIASLETIHLKLQEKLQIEKLSLIELQAKEKEIQSSIQKKLRCEKRLLEIAEEISQKDEQIAANKEEMTTASNQISSLEGKLAAYKADLLFATKIEAEAALKTDRKECSDLQEELQKTETAYQNCDTNLGNVKAVLADNQLKYTKKENELLAAEKEWMDKLYRCGFGEPGDYKKALLQEEELERQVSKLDTYRKNCEQVSQQIEQLLTDTKEQEEKNLSVILADQEELDHQKRASEEAMQNIYSRLKTNSEIRDQVNEKYKEQEKMRQEYITVSDLSKTANGELSGKAKIAFEQYVQAFYFNSVISEANKRLYKMTNSQYILLRKEDASNLKSSCGLELEVMDYYTGKPRSIKSLSGGESFKAALSMALGLSDVIQSFAGGIEVDAMFIDEGFGSLDSNSLEQAIETLNTLTMGNRFVGIISHVSELKERIDKKIVITKSIDGSRLTLVK